MNSVKYHGGIYLLGPHHFHLKRCSFAKCVPHASGSSLWALQVWSWQSGWNWGLLFCLVSMLDVLVFIRAPQPSSNSPLFTVKKKKKSLGFLLRLTESSLRNYRLNCFLIAVSKIVVLSLSHWFIFTPETLTLITDHVSLHMVAAAKPRVPAPPLFFSLLPLKCLQHLTSGSHSTLWLQSFIHFYLILLVLKPVTVSCTHLVLK